MANLKLWFKQNTPELLMVSGIVNSAAAVVTACVATLKVEKKVINPAKSKIVELHNKKDILSHREGTTKQDLDAVDGEIRKAYAKAGFKIAAYYAPSALLFGLSVASNVGSHNILKGRNIALASAFASLKSSYDLYREKVANKIGEEAEQALFEDTEVKKVSSKDSKGREIVKTIVTPKLDTDNICGCFWGPGCGQYDHKIGAVNMTYLLQQEVYLNQALQAKGYVFLSEVYDRLGIRAGVLGQRRLQAAQVVGWIFDPNDKTRDNYIDFGLHDANGKLTEKAKDFQSGIADFVWLNFNFDGDILTGEHGQKTYMEYAMKKGN